MPREPLVQAVCRRCQSTLRPGFGGRLRCPRLAACGYGGVTEDARAARAFHARRLRVGTRLTFAELPVTA